MKVCKIKLSKAARESLAQNSAKGSDGYMLAPPNRLDMKVSSLGAKIFARNTRAYD